MASCGTSQWTYRFPEVTGPDGPFEIKPFEMSLSINRKKYDYCHAEFHTDVGEQMKPHTRAKGGKLRSPQPVEVCLDGEVVKTLYFKPDYARYANNGTFVELHDLQESMDSGVVDNQWKKVKLKEAYKHAFNQRTNDLLNDIKFSIPEDTVTEIQGQAEISQPIYRITQLDGFRYDVRKILRGKKVRSVEADSTKKLVESYYAVDFDQISPAKAIWKLNQMFKIQTWVDNDRNLWVGSPESMAKRHLAAPDDDRVFRYNNNEVQVSHPREPIFAVIVEGRWLDEEGIGESQDILNWFNTSEENSRGFGDYRAEGVAFRPDVEPENGQVIKMKDTDAKKDALDEVARTQLREMSKAQNSGTVQLIPELSGDDVSRLADIRVGDGMQLVPDDKHFDSPTASSGELGDRPDRDFKCGAFIYNELYSVEGVTHNVSQGDWKVTVNIGMFPDFAIGKYLRLFDPRSGEIVSEEDVYLDADGGIPQFLKHPLEEPETQDSLYQLSGGEQQDEEGT